MRSLQPPPDSPLLRAHLGKSAICRRRRTGRKARRRNVNALSEGGRSRNENVDIVVTRQALDMRVRTDARQEPDLGAVRRRDEMDGPRRPLASDLASRLAW